MLLTLRIGFAYVWCYLFAGVTCTPGREFLVAFLQNVVVQTTPTPRLYVTSHSSQSVVVTVTLPGMSVGLLWPSSVAAPFYSQTYTLASAGQVAEVVFPSALQLSGTNIENKAVRIQASDYVTVHVANVADWSTGVYLALPIDVVGSLYYVMSQVAARNGSGVNSGLSELAIISTVDNTNIQLDFGPDTPVSVVGLGLTMSPIGRSSIVNLKLYQTFQLRNVYDLTGMKIMSSNPVVVLCGVEWVAQLTSTQQVVSGSHVALQLAPVSAWGQLFLVTPTATRTNHRIRLLAWNNDTAVDVVWLTNKEVTYGNVNSTSDSSELTINLQMSERVPVDLHCPASLNSCSARINASQSILVGQFSTGTSLSNNSDVTYDGGPLFTLIQSFNQMASDYTFVAVEPQFSTDTQYQQLVTVMTDSLATGSIVVDNRLLGAADYHLNWTTLPGTMLSRAILNVKTGGHRLYTLTGHPVVGYVTGIRNNDAYQYPLGLVQTGIPYWTPGQLTDLLWSSIGPLPITTDSTSISTTTALSTQAATTSAVRYTHYNYSDMTSSQILYNETSTVSYVDVSGGNSSTRIVNASYNSVETTTEFSGRIQQTSVNDEQFRPMYNDTSIPNSSSLASSDSTTRLTTTTNSTTVSRTYVAVATTSSHWQNESRAAIATPSLTSRSRDVVNTTTLLLNVTTSPYVEFTSTKTSSSSSSSSERTTEESYSSSEVVGETTPDLSDVMTTTISVATSYQPSMDTSRMSQSTTVVETTLELGDVTSSLYTTVSVQHDYKSQLQQSTVESTTKTVSNLTVATAAFVNRTTPSNIVTDNSGKHELSLGVGLPTAVLVTLLTSACAFMCWRATCDKTTTLPFITSVKARRRFHRVGPETVFISSHDANKAAGCESVVTSSSTSSECSIRGLVSPTPTPSPEPEPQFGCVHGPLAVASSRWTSTIEPLSPVYHAPAATAHIGGYSLSYADITRMFNVVSKTDQHRPLGKKNCSSNRVTELFETAIAGVDSGAVTAMTSKQYGHAASSHTEHRHAP